MKLYYDKEATPLNFHEFFRYIALPFSATYIVLKLLGELFFSPFSFSFYLFDILNIVVSLALQTACFVGFFHWKPYAWYSTFALLAFGLLPHLPTVIIYSPFLSEWLAAAASVIYSTLVGVYYWKRKPLFFPSMIVAHNASVAQNNPHAAEQIAPPVYTQGATSVPMDASFASGKPVVPEVRNCRICGYHLIQNDIFCSSCGTKVVREPEIEML